MVTRLLVTALNCIFVSDNFFCNDLTDLSSSSSSTLGFDFDFFFSAASLTAFSALRLSSIFCLASGVSFHHSSLERRPFFCFLPPPVVAAPAKAVPCACTSPFSGCTLRKSFINCIAVVTVGGNDLKSPFAYPFLTLSLSCSCSLLSLLSRNRHATNFSFTTTRTFNFSSAARLS